MPLNEHDKDLIEAMFCDDCDVNTVLKVWHSNLNVVANDFFQPRKYQSLEHGVDKAFTEICKVEHADSRTIILATTRWQQCDGPGPRPVILAYLLGVVEPQRIQRKIGPCAVHACATRQIRVASVLAQGPGDVRLKFEGIPERGGLQC
jgi:hypothetical protein